MLWREQRNIQTKETMLAAGVLNALAIIVLFCLTIWLVVHKGCNSVPPRPLTVGEQAGVDVSTLLEFVDALNVVTNLLIVVPGLMMAVMGFPIEGGVVLLCGVFSCLWHATGIRGFAVADGLLATLAFITMFLGYCRIVQLRGWPEFTAFYVAVPLAGMLAFVGGNAFVGKDVSDHTRFITDRMAHSLWHVLVAASFYLVVMELQRVPGLIPNRPLREAIRARDEKMRRSLWKQEGAHGSPPASLVYGLFRDLVRKKKITT
jgi:hypothetical protein